MKKKQPYQSISYLLICLVLYPFVWTKIFRDCKVSIYQAKYNIYRVETLLDIYVSNEQKQKESLSPQSLQ